MSEPVLSIGDGVKQGRSGPLRRGITVAALVAYGLLAFVFGLDRIAYYHPRVPAPIGWNYDSDAALGLAGDAIRAHQHARGAFFARRAVLSNPLDPHVVGAYGLTILLNGDAAAAERVFAVAGLLGWRDDTTQLAESDRAIRLGNMTAAAQRVDALMRQTPDIPAGNVAIAKLLAFEEGRTALAQRLELGPDWALNFVRGMDGLSDDDVYARYDTAMRVKGQVFDCASIGYMVDRLVNAGYVTQAKAFSDRVCGGSGAIVDDGTFSRVDLGIYQGMLHWRRAQRGDVDVTPSPEPGGGQRLTIESSAPSVTSVLWQMVVVDPGRYRVTWQMPDTSDTDVSHLAVTFGCDNDWSESANGTLIGPRERTYAADFTFDGTCPAPTLMFWLQPNHAVSIRRVRVDRLPG